MIERVTLFVATRTDELRVWHEETLNRWRIFGEQIQVLIDQHPDYHPLYQRGIGYCAFAALRLNGLDGLTLYAQQDLVKKMLPPIGPWRLDTGGLEGTYVADRRQREGKTLDQLLDTIKFSEPPVPRCPQKVYVSNRCHFPRVERYGAFWFLHYTCPPDRFAQAMSEHEVNEETPTGRHWQSASYQGTLDPDHWGPCAASDYWRERERADHRDKLKPPALLRGTPKGAGDD